MGLEFRIQMPVINVPFRLIFAYNPQAKTDITDPTVLFIEQAMGRLRLHVTGKPPTANGFFAVCANAGGPNGDIAAAEASSNCRRRRLN